MKAPLFFVGMATLTMVMASCSATYTVRERPADVVYVRPAAPSPSHVWVSGNWVWRGGRYVWQEGYWAPRRSGMRYVEGHWQSTRKGWVWRAGHWQ